MEHQDWKPVVLKGNKKSSKTQNKKFNGDNKMAKIDQATDVVKPKFFPRDLAQQIIKYRTNNKLNRKQFAQRLNIKESLLADIETCKAVYNGTLVDKFKRIINKQKTD